MDVGGRASEHFYQMRPGVIPVRAPVIDGVIQVDYFKDVEKTHLRVTVEGDDDSPPDSITVRRKDRAAIQLDMCNSKRYMLAEPLGEIIFTRHRSGLWLADQPELVVVEGQEDNFQTFASHLGIFALKKQRRLINHALFAGIRPRI